MLLSNAIDRSIDQMDFDPLVGKTVFLNSEPMENVTDQKYIVSTLRQHMLAQGCVLRDKREDAEYVAEARAGAVGTDSHSLLFGVPSMNLPSAGLVPGAPSAIPEIPLAKSSTQKGVAKLAVFAYHRESGLPVWQSGAFPVASDAKHVWFFGTGPFESGSIYDGTRFAGAKPFSLKDDDDIDDPHAPRPSVPVTAEAKFDSPIELAQKPEKPTTVPPTKSPDEKPSETQTTTPQDTGIRTAGHVIRLPSIEAAKRPDLEAQVEANAAMEAGKRGESSLGHLPQTPNAGAKGEPTPAAKETFSERWSRSPLRPKNWF
jgi:hypothetical protein